MNERNVGIKYTNNSTLYIYPIALVETKDKLTSLRQ